MQGQGIDDRELTFNVLGCGRISRRHLGLLSSGSIGQAKLGAVCDIDGDRARAAGEKYGVPFFTDYASMMETVPCDAVSILTESGHHAEHAVALAPYGKHIVVEKPMALTLDSADAMIRACDESRIKLFVVKQNRFNRAVQALRRALDDDRLGKLVLGTVRVRWCRTQDYYDQDKWRGTWALDGGVLANQASHHIDLLEWMMGDVDTVVATTRAALVDIEAEDTAVAILQFRNGAVGVVEATTAARPRDLEGSLSILGSRGAVEVGGFAVNEIRHWEFGEPRPEDAAIFQEAENPPDVYGFGHRAYYEHVVDCILHDSPQLVDGLEGRRSLELILALYESAETGQPVNMRFQQRASKLGQPAGAR